MEWSSTPATSRFDAPFAFEDLQQKLNSIEGDDENDAYWNTSGLGGFNFEEDGPAMYFSPKPAPERPQVLEFKPKIDKEPQRFVTAPAGRRNTPKQTVEDIFLGNAYNLEQFRSREEKVQLLDAALDIGDTATVQVIVLFLRSTLKFSIMQQEIISRPAALMAYASYLRESGENAQLIEQLSLSGHSDAAAKNRYRVISQIQDMKARTKALESSVNTHFLGCNDVGLMKDELNLLQIQAKIQEIDKVTLELADDILGVSLVTTVNYCSKHHDKDPDTHFASPGFLKQAFKLSAEQYSHARITGYAETRNYEALESFLESKSWLGKKRLSSAIGFDRIVQILFDHKAPVDILEKYIAYVDDVEERMELARRIGAMTSLVNCFVQKKNRADLEALMSKLPRDSTAALLAQSHLNNPAIKWKT